MDYNDIQSQKILGEVPSENRSWFFMVINGEFHRGYLVFLWGIVSEYKIYNVYETE